jgi:hypothetical protein
MHIEELQMKSEDRTAEDFSALATVVVVVNCPGPYWWSFYDTELEYSWQAPGHSYSEVLHRMIRRHCK